MISRLPRMRFLHALLALLYLFSTSASAATLNFTVTTNKPVTVSGTPRLVLDVGGVQRYATYSAGSGTNTLTFSYAVQARDFDANGIALSSSLDMNGGSFTDSAGNTVNSSISFTAPNTSGIRIQTYTTAFITSPITTANANAVSFTIFKAPQNATFNYSITSSGGPGSVDGSGTINSSSHIVSGVNVGILPVGTLTLSVTVSNIDGGTGTARTATALLDNVAPTGYSASFVTSPVISTNSSAASIQIVGGEIGSDYSYTISSSGGGIAVNGSGTVSADPQPVTGINLSSLGDGTLTLSVTLTDTNSNAGSAVTATTTKDTVAPTIVSVTPPADGTYDDL
jgi:hypothetical protein